MPDPELIKPHPNITDPIENERCPTCGTPGIQRTRIGQLVIMDCPRCDTNGEQQ